MAYSSDVPGFVCIDVVDRQRANQRNGTRAVVTPAFATAALFPALFRAVQAFCTWDAFGILKVAFPPGCPRAASVPDAWTVVFVRSCHVCNARRYECPSHSGVFHEG